MVTIPVTGQGISDPSLVQEANSIGKGSTSWTLMGTVIWTSSGPHRPATLSFMKVGRGVPLHRHRPSQRLGSQSPRAMALASSQQT